MKRTTRFAAVVSLGLLTFPTLALPAPPPRKWVDPGMVGQWTMKRGAVTDTWIIHPDATYQYRQGGRFPRADQGTLQAGNGRVVTISTTGASAIGPAHYEFRGKEMLWSFTSSRAVLVFTLTSRVLPLGRQNPQANLQGKTAQQIVKLGIAYDDAGDFANALLCYSRAAEMGDALGINDVGTLYETGHDVPGSFEKAVALYTKAADKGLPVAMNNLAYMYERGRGIEPDLVKAIDLYKKAGGLGDKLAKENLQRLASQVTLLDSWIDGRVVRYDFGKGKEAYNAKDMAGAARWFLKAAQYGYNPAEFQIAWHYNYGKGVPPNPTEATRWYERASAHGNLSARYVLGTIRDAQFRAQMQKQFATPDDPFADCGKTMAAACESSRYPGHNMFEDRELDEKNGVRD